MLRQQIPQVIEVVDDELRFGRPGPPAQDVHAIRVRRNRIGVHFARKPELYGRSVQRYTQGGVLTTQREIGLTASPTGHDLPIHVSRDRHLSGSLLGGTDADGKDAGEENGAKQSRRHGVPSTTSDNDLTPLMARQAVVNRRWHSEPRATDYGVAACRPYPSTSVYPRSASPCFKLRTEKCY